MVHNEITKAFCAAERSMDKVSNIIRTCYEAGSFEMVEYAAIYFATEGGRNDAIDSQNGKFKSLRTMFLKVTEDCGQKLTLKIQKGTIKVAEPSRRGPGKKPDEQAKRNKKLSDAENALLKVTEDNQQALVDSIVRQMQRAGLSLDDLAERMAVLDKAA